MEMEQQLLSLVFDGASKDDLIDLLMGLEQVSGFTLSEVSGFSHEHAQYDIAEQVAGYRQLYRIDVLHNPEQLNVLLQALKGLGTANGIRYWVTPVLEAGKL